LDELENHPDFGLRDFIIQEKARLNREVEAERHAETLADRVDSELFE
jgi:hypothetical protein